MIIPIQPVPSYPGSGVYLDVYNGVVELNTTAKFLYQLLDSGQNVVSRTWQNALTSGQYANWGDSDTYVAYCVAQNVGLTPITGG